MRKQEADPFDHEGFIASVLEKHSIEMAIPDIDHQEYLLRIVECFRSGRSGYSLLAMSMSAYLFEHCYERIDYEPLVSLSKEIEKVLLSGKMDYDIVVTARELRSVLFWGYLRLGHKDKDLLEGASHLLSAMTGCDYETALKADAVLSHGSWQLDTHSQGFTF